MHEHGSQRTDAQAPVSAMQNMAPHVADVAPVQDAPGGASDVQVVFCMLRAANSASSCVYPLSNQRPAQCDVPHDALVCSTAIFGQRTFWFLFLPTKS